MIKQLNELASEIIGDGQDPNVYFVTVKDNVVLVATDVAQAYGYWRSLANTRVESSLEDRKIGVIADAGYLSEDAPHRWEVYDDARRFGLVG